MNPYFKEAGWKKVLQDNKGKLKDNGLQRALTVYEHLPEEKVPEREKALTQISKLAWAIGKTKEIYAAPDANEYLQGIIQATAQEQEKIYNDKKAAEKAAKVDDATKLALQNMIIEAAQNVSTNAKANATFFGRQVVAACKAFEIYSKNKLEDLEGGITAGDLLGPLLGAITGGVGEMIAERVVDEIGKKIVKELAKVAEDKIKKRAESIGNDSKDLQKAVDALVMGATDMATAFEGVVTRTIIPLCDEVIRGINSGKRLSDPLTAFIEPFIRIETAKLDLLLQQRFGLPTPAKSKQTQVKIFKDMVQSFEKKLIIAKTSSGEKMEWVITGVPVGVNRAAEARANKAGKDRETEISEKEAEMAGR